MTPYLLTTTTYPTPEKHESTRVSPFDSVALRQDVSAITTRLESLNRRRQADEYRKLAHKRSWLIARLLPYVRELGVALSLLAVMRGEALTYGREVVRTMVLTNPSGYDESIQALAVPDLLLLASVLEAVDQTGLETNGLVHQVQRMASAAHRQLAG